MPPESLNLFENKSVKQVVLELLTGDLYFHEQFRDIFAALGCKVLSVRKHWFHDIFEVRLRRSGSHLPKDDVRAARQIRGLLKKAGLGVPRDSIHLIQRGNSVRVVFIFRGGAEGVLHC